MTSAAKMALYSFFTVDRLTLAVLNLQTPIIGSLPKCAIREDVRGGSATNFRLRLPPNRYR